MTDGKSVELLLQLVFIEPKNDLNRPHNEQL